MKSQPRQSDTYGIPSLCWFGPNESPCWKFFIARVRVFSGYMIRVKGWRGQGLRMEGGWRSEGSSEAPVRITLFQPLGSPLVLSVQGSFALRTQVFGCPDEYKARLAPTWVLRQNQELQSGFTSLSTCGFSRSVFLCLGCFCWLFCKSRWSDGVPILDSLGSWSEGPV